VLLPASSGPKGSNASLSRDLQRLLEKASQSRSVTLETFPNKTEIVLPVGSAETRLYFYVATIPVPPPPFLRPLINIVVPLTGVFGFLCYFLAAYFVRPITQLSRVADQFGAGEFKARVPASLSKRKDELGELGRTFDRMAIQIESLVDGYKKFLAHASHELGSPLTRLNLTLALAKRKAQPNLEQDLGRIGTEANKLNHIVQELLLLARLESGNELNRRTSSFKIADIVEGVCADARVEAEQLSKTIGFSRSETFDLCGYPELLRRAIDNVVRNAIRFARLQGRVEVSYFSQPDTELGIVQIRDDGPGVAPGHFDAIFEPFFRGPLQENEVDPAGSGLGLAIARQAVLANGGTIQAIASEVNWGLTIEIRLPLGAETATPSC
jgi:two-component system sensor histidine kinase CpxA